MSEMNSPTVDRAPSDSIEGAKHVERHLTHHREDVERLFRIMNTYGGCHGSVIAWTQASAVQNTWYDISDADIYDGQLSGVIHDGNGLLTVPYAGKYECYYAISVICSISDHHLEGAFSINGTETNDGVNRIEVPAIDNEILIAGCAIFDLSADDTINISIRTINSGTPDLTVDHYTLIAKMIAD